MKESTDSSSVSGGEEITQPIPITFTVPQNSTTAAQQKTTQDVDAQQKLKLSELQMQEPPQNKLLGPMATLLSEEEIAAEAYESEASSVNINMASAGCGDEKENSQSASLTLVSDVKLDLFDPEISDSDHH